MPIRFHRSKKEALKTKAKWEKTPLLYAKVKKVKFLDSKMKKVDRYQVIA